MLFMPGGLPPGLSIPVFQAAVNTSRLPFTAFVNVSISRLYPVAIIYFNKSNEYISHSYFHAHALHKNDNTRVHRRCAGDASSL